MMHRLEHESYLGDDNIRHHLWYCMCGKILGDEIDLVQDHPAALALFVRHLRAWGLA